MDVDVLMDDVSPRARAVLASMVAGANALGINIRPAGKPSSRVLLLWGAPRPDHAARWRDQLSSGGRCVGLDVGYPLGRKSFRICVDTTHPTPEQMQAVPATPRFAIPALREDASPTGPAMLVGMGGKSVRAAGGRSGDWEIAAARRHAGRRLEYRPKRRPAAIVPGVKLAEEVPIAQGLRGRSLVICAHSNVAIDACIAGVPVICEAGAAFALYRENPNPSAAQRSEFLARLTWFDYLQSEAQEAWTTVQRLISR